MVGHIGFVRIAPPSERVPSLTSAYASELGVDQNRGGKKTGKNQNLNAKRSLVNPPRAFGGCRMVSPAAACSRLVNEKERERRERDKAAVMSFSTLHKLKLWRSKMDPASKTHIAHTVEKASCDIYHSMQAKAKGNSRDMLGWAARFATDQLCAWSLLIRLGLEDLGGVVPILDYASPVFVTGPVATDSEKRAMLEAGYSITTAG